MLYTKNGLKNRTILGIVCAISLHQEGKCAMQWYSTSLGKKFIMAVTGLIMVGFILVHMIGNFTLFAGAAGINAYAEGLRAIPPLLWGFRLVMLVVFVLHVWTGISLYLENKAARPVAYARQQLERTSFSARTMVWTGLLLGVFIVYHLLHFTIRVTHPEISHFVDAAGRHDVFAMVVLSFQRFFPAAMYAAAMIILLLHLAHGVQSFFQSLGLSRDDTLPRLEMGGRGVAFVLMVGFLLVPLSIFFGLVRL
jgi:succinate dehydrogenase / fumarate reductase, cytochrome b subunit